MALASSLISASTAERAALVERYCAEWGVSAATARRHAATRLRAAPPPAAGYPVAPEVLDQVVAVWLASATEKYSEATMPIGDVIDTAESAGILTPGALSASQLQRYISERKITLRDQRRGSPHISLASRHPNHVHLADVTRCRQWYLRPNGTLDPQSFQSGTKAYRNKDLKGIPLFRYVLVDHATGIPYVQYHTDETVPTLLTFLAGAWYGKRQRHEVGPSGTERWWPAPFDPAARWEEWSALPALRDYHFRGAPAVLVLDRAGANQSGFTAELCRRLGIRLVIAQEARAKGAVETMMWIWERKFESRLAVQPAPDLATLNVWALDFLQRYCLREVHSRHGLTRSQAWAQIAPEQLRELPPWPIFRELARREPEARTVKSGEAGHGRIYHEGKAYRVPDAVELVGQQVQVSYSAFSEATIEARTADGRVLICDEERRDRWGFVEGAPVIGESYARHADTSTQKTEKRLAAVRAALPPLRVFGREGERGDTPALLPPRQGVEIPITMEAGAREISRAQFNSRVLAALGGRALTDAEGAERDRRWAGQRTLPESSVDEFVRWCAEAVAQRPALRVVNLHR
jgi:hypothetical protein